MSAFLSFFFIVVETPENGGKDLLLTSEFLKECLELYSAPSRGFETNPRVFPVRHLNIIDPLKENNNLGRSVSKGLPLILFLQPTQDFFCFPYQEFVILYWFPLNI